MPSQAPGNGDEFLREVTYAFDNVIALAKAMPEDKFGWRPAEGVRSFSEAAVHIGGVALGLMGRAGMESAPDGTTIRRWEKEATTKAGVLELLDLSREAVEREWTATDEKKLAKKLDIPGQEFTAGAMWLRMLAEVNEHLGQMVAYARIHGVVPPWSEGESKQ